MPEKRGLKFYLQKRNRRALAKHLTAFITVHIHAATKDVLEMLPLIKVCADQCLIKGYSNMLNRHCDGNDITLITVNTLNNRTVPEPHSYNVVIS